MDQRLSLEIKTFLIAELQIPHFPANERKEQERKEQAGPALGILESARRKVPGKQKKARAEQQAPLPEDPACQLREKANKVIHALDLKLILLNIPLLVTLDFEEKIKTRKYISFPQS